MARTVSMKPSSNRRWVRRWQVAGLIATVSASSALLSPTVILKQSQYLKVGSIEPK
ncbi:transposase-like protein [Bradyrhizobium diazoefficiens]